MEAAPVRPTPAEYFRFASIEVERTMALLAMTDALTKLPNRRRMREILDCLRHADEALYVGKEHGRNQVVVLPVATAPRSAGGAV